MASPHNALAFRNETYDQSASLSDLEGENLSKIYYLIIWS